MTINGNGQRALDRRRVLVHIQLCELGVEVACVVNPMAYIGNKGDTTFAFSMRCQSMEL